VVRHCLAVHCGGGAYRTRFPTHSSIDEQISTWPTIDMSLNRNRPYRVDKVRSSAGVRYMAKSKDVFNLKPEGPLRGRGKDLVGSIKLT